jgi:hypothetical protein
VRGFFICIHENIAAKAAPTQDHPVFPTIPVGAPSGAIMAGRKMVGLGLPSALAFLQLL